jgi:hypothetical protein
MEKPAMLSHIELGKANTIRELATLIGVEPSTLSYVLYHIDTSKKYTEFFIPKKSGGERKISSPQKTLKFVQKKLADFLQRCYEEAYDTPPLIEKKEIKVNKQEDRKRSNYIISHGFQKGMSILTNAENHVNKRYVFNIDLENFFPSFNSARVYAFFSKNKHFKCTSKTAAYITQIATFNNELPQGAPTSPVISNLIMHSLDVRLLNLAKRYKCFYTRYADDLTFSTNLSSFPPQLAVKSDKGEWNTGEKLKNEIEKAGFKVNLSKIRLQEKNSRQEVTGIVVNKTINTQKNYYRLARALCHSLFNTGTYKIPTSFNNAQKINDATDNLNVLTGILNHIYTVKTFRNKYADKGFRDTKNKVILKKDIKDYLNLRSNSYSDESHEKTFNGIQNLWIKFNYFKHFYALKNPLIFCEGKTDNIYLKAALKQLDSKLPPSISSNGKVKLTFFNLTSHFEKSCSFAPGSSGQTHLIASCEKFFEKFKCEGKAFPVIIISDNDVDGRKVDAAAKKKSEHKNHGSNAQFIHIYDNLYHVLLPKTQTHKENTTIEDFFPDLNAIGIDAKRLNLSNQKTKDGEMGKARMAEHIYKNQEQINFDSFLPIFEIIDEIIQDYEQKRLANDESCAL